MPSRSYNDDAQRYDGTIPNLPSPPPGRDRNNECGPAPLYHMNAAFAEPDSRIQNYDSFNTKNRKVDNTYNNNFQEYAGPPSRRVKKPKERPVSLGEANLAQIPDKGEPEAPPSNGAPKKSQATFAGGGNPSYCDDPRTRGIPQPDAAQSGRSYTYPLPTPQPMYPYNPYGYAPFMLPHPYYANYGGYPQPHIPGVHQMGESQGWMSPDPMNQARPKTEKGFNRIREELVQHSDTSDDEDNDDAESESETDGNVKQVPKAVEDEPSKDMEQMRLGDEFRPGFSHIVSDSQKQSPTHPANNSPIQQDDEDPNLCSAPDILAPQKNLFVNFGGPPLPYGAGSQGVPFAPHFPSPFYSNVSPTGFPFGPHPDRYMHIDNSVHTHNFESGNTANKTIQDSYNDNQIKGATGRIKEKAYRKKGSSIVLKGGSGHRVAGRDFNETSNIN